MKAASLPQGAAERDYYDILSVAPEASPQEIKKRWKKIARDLHPDRGGDPAEFAVASEAYEVLSDPEKKEAWEDLRRYGAPTGWSGGFPGFNQGSNSNFDIDLDEIIFGFQSGAKRRASRPVRDITIDALQALEGGGIDVTTADGKRVNAVLPSRVSDEDMFEMDGEIYRVHVTPHPVYEVIGDDLEVHSVIMYTELVLGGKVSVPTPDGPVRMNVAPGTQTTKRHRLKERGATVGGKKKDLYVTFHVHIPETITEEEKELLQRYHAGSGAESLEEARRMKAEEGRR